MPNLLEVQSVLSKTNHGETAAGTLVLTVHCALKQPAFQEHHRATPFSRHFPTCPINQSIKNHAATSAAIRKTVFPMFRQTLPRSGSSGFFCSLSVMITSHFPGSLRCGFSLRLFHGIGFSTSAMPQRSMW